MKMLYMIMFVLFAVCGGVMQSSYFTVSADAGTHTSDNTIDIQIKIANTFFIRNFLACKKRPPFIF